MSDTHDAAGADKAEAIGLEHKTSVADGTANALQRQFASSAPEYHHDMTKRLLRKVDFHLLPFLILMYLLNFLDRNNLSQARLGTLEEELGMTGTDFNLATSILFVGYLLMQLPSNLIITRVRPSLYLGSVMTVWGTISASQAATHSFGALIACRFFLGFAEAPFFPGAIFLMSSWYTRAELAHRIAWFYAGSSLANAFGGLLGAGVLGNLSGAHGISGWRWLFIIEGVITIGVAITAAFVLPDYPATTKWLTDEEKAYAQWRLVDDIGEADEGGAASVKEGVLLALRDPKLYLFTLLQHTSLLSQSFQYFFPTIVKTLGYGNIETLLITAPVWIGTFLVSLVVTYTSGKYHDRSIHIICLMIISVIGNIIVVSSLNTAARFFAMFLMPMGAVSAYQIIVAWVSNSFPRPLVKRSACISIANMIGNCANIYGSYMYPASDGPRYLAGGSATAAVALLVALMAFGVRLVLKRDNKKFDAREQTARETGEEGPAMMAQELRIKSVAIIGGGAAGAVTAAALKAENYFDKITVFERREKAGGTWIYDADPQPPLTIYPGALPVDIDPPLDIPDQLPSISPPSKQERYSKTPVYDSLTTNVPDIAMSFSDAKFAYGPFAPHYVPRQYIENYFCTHGIDKNLVLNTTVEDVSKLSSNTDPAPDRWKLTLRKYDTAKHVDIWWEETFDAVILANGHYSVPYVPEVIGLEQFVDKFPGRVVHSKYYRSPSVYTGQKILVIGNSASGHDITSELLKSAQLPVYQSRRSKSRWDGKEPPPGIFWKPIITEYGEDGRVWFQDGTHLDGLDKIIYCTGYKPSFPFWNSKANGRPLWDYQANKLVSTYWHTFFHDFKTLAIVGMPRVLSFRSWEYQAIALARLFSNRNAGSLPSPEAQRKWELERDRETKRERRPFHGINWDEGETQEWLDGLFQIAGLGTLKGDGRIPPVLSKELVWALENIKKYPEPDSEPSDDESDLQRVRNEDESDWVLIPENRKDSLAFI